MNRDNVLFALMGMVLGFVAAYPVFEAMSSRQPLLRPPGQSLPGDGAAQDGGEEPAPGGAQAPGAQGGPAVEQIRQLRARIEKNPQDADAIRELGQLNISINDLLRAKDLFERYVQLRPDDPEGVLILGNLYYDTKDFAHARERYEAYLKTDPDNPDVLTDLGVSYRNLKEPQRALTSFRRAQELKPEHWVALYNEVVVLAFDLANFDDAEKALARLRQGQPGNPDVDQLAAEVAKRRKATK